MRIKSERPQLLALTALCKAPYKLRNFFPGSRVTRISQPTFPTFPYKTWGTVYMKSKQKVCLAPGKLRQSYNQGQKQLTHMFKTGAFNKHLIHLLFHSF